MVAFLLSAFQTNTSALVCRSMEFPIRINKYLAHQGIASRREADQLIADGLVHINHKVAKLGDVVNETDRVVVSKLVEEKQHEYYAYHKPFGVISVTSDGGDESIAERIAHDHDLHNVFPIGRLDKNSTGLIILTNDGRITSQVLDPKNKHEKEYEVSVNKTLKENFKRLMERGVDIEGYTTKPCTVKVTGQKSFRIILTEGKRHQIRRMCMNLGYTVEKLKRVRIGKLTLGNLKSGEVWELSLDEIK